MLRAADKCTTKSFVFEAKNFVKNRLIFYFGKIAVFRVDFGAKNQQKVFFNFWRLFRQGK